MMNITKRIKRMTLGFVLATVPMLGGCSDNTITWQEEVKLLDGRVITVTQKRRIDGDRIEREAWLTFKLPEFSDKEIVWHENLDILVLNVYQSKIYVVAIPGTEREFRQYGSPMPSYIGYKYDNGQWLRLPFNEVPPAIYHTNMYFENMDITKLNHVSLAVKEELVMDERYPSELKVIDPSSKKH
jgi:hypothetical protein